jgi:hypothetical protein
MDEWGLKNEIKKLQKIGVFLGIQTSNYEYIAHIISPYQLDYIPKIGSFILVQNRQELIVGRIMDMIPKGEFTTFTGEKWLADVALYENAIGQDIKNQKISYEIQVKSLGRITQSNHLHNTPQPSSQDIEKPDDFTFIPGIEAIPHITSNVYAPNQRFQEIICNQAMKKQEKGIKLGEYYLNQSIDIQFNVQQLIGKRTFIFARAGYGKSNLMKILASNWKPKHGALFIFDPEGEYSITDNKGRPGIMDKIPSLIITNRPEVRKELTNNVYTHLKFNLKEFTPNFIIPILVPEKKHETIFFQKLMSLKQEKWNDIVDLFYEDGWGADDLTLTHLSVNPNANKPDSSVGPFKNNLVGPIKKLHDPNSKLLSILVQAAQENRVVILDISLMDSHSALQFSSIIVAHFFNQNQKSFLKGTTNFSRIVFVMEEAQSILGEKTNASKFVELAKEGRKYHLGGIFITQQPSSIASQILSQADNFFAFHMISKSDLVTLQQANAHYSNDVLTQILNEPIPGKCYIWSSPQPFVLPLKVLNFEGLAKPHNAAQIQGLNDILTPILAKVTQFNTIEKGILKKLLNVLEEGEIDITSQDDLDLQKSHISITTFQKLNGDEKKYIIEKNWAAINRNTQEPYGIHYKHLFKLIEKASILKSS